MCSGVVEVGKYAHYTRSAMKLGYSFIASSVFAGIKALNILKVSS